ncbi:hypothetical protein AOL_s00043g212 [Orbilia oligospora ATCC 24927]|uniref:Uncharacterized protein n=1 Tax=Arthrobotrys oligospora (strain ATCC 24927 / CBS 115.81 / DSM 1491) TaxID=756982 RepID=G1X3D9_ARTOA|nr:hypothetical protein AOL_s00043g212 [Orbilia oligospora ATCC 24927]EGX52423.1 hypothetical protein AOL_s00043g212 [Orbilia oligospora ATCC 24927]
MSHPDFRTASASAEGSQAAFETAVEVLSGFREGNANPTSQPIHDHPRLSIAAHLIPQTEEEVAYDQCKKLSIKTSMSKVREELGIPSTGMANDYTWDQLSKLVDRTLKELNYEFESISSLTKLSQAIQNSLEWQECTPQRPASAYVPVLIYRWKKGRRDPPKRRRARKLH